jgi:DNA-binding Lrp family transcriptional regulator
MNTDLDRIDFRILDALQNNGRLSNKELAARVHLSPSACWERVRRLHEEGVLKGYHAEVDPKALGIGLRAMIGVSLTRHTREAVESFQAHALATREVMAVYHVTGARDFLIQVAVRDADHLRDLALEAFTTHPEVANLETSLIFQGHHKPGLPIPEASADLATDA